MLTPVYPCTTMHSTSAFNTRRDVHAPWMVFTTQVGNIIGTLVVLLFLGRGWEASLLAVAGLCFGQAVSCL